MKSGECHPRITKPAAANPKPENLLLVIQSYAKDNALHSNINGTLWNFARSQGSRLFWDRLTTYLKWFASTLLQVSSGRFHLPYSDTLVSSSSEVRNVNELGVTQIFLLGC